jgi:hypothetical protein
MAKKETRKFLVSTDWRTVFSMWTNISNTIMASVAAWYAADDTPKSLISPTVFASMIAVWGLVNIASLLARSLPK